LVTGNSVRYFQEVGGRHVVENQKANKSVLVLRMENEINENEKMMYNYPGKVYLHFLEV